MAGPMKAFLIIPKGCASLPGLALCISKAKIETLATFPYNNGGKLHVCQRL